MNRFQALLAAAAVLAGGAYLGGRFAVEVAEVPGPAAPVAAAAVRAALANIGV